MRAFCVWLMTEVGVSRGRASAAGCIDPEEVSGGQEVSETGSVAVSSFLTQRSEISTPLSFYILGSSGAVSFPSGAEVVGLLSSVSLHAAHVYETKLWPDLGH